MSRMTDRGPGFDQALVPTPGTTPTTKAAGSWSRQAPALLLLVVAPLVAEFLLGDVTLASLGALLVFIPLYGAGALLIREVVRRGNGGWPAIVVFAAAFAVVEEGLGTQSLFNPDYAHAHLLAAGYLPSLGIAVPWTVHVISLHVIWSICTSIALVECLFPERRAVPWLGTGGLILSGVLYLLGISATAVTTGMSYGFAASPLQLLGAAAVAAALVLVAVVLGARRRSCPSPRMLRRAPSPWAVGIAAAAATSILVLAPDLPQPVISSATYLVVESVAIVAIVVWSRRSDWGAHHVLALAAAALFAYAWRAFFSTPAFDSAPLALVRISNAVFAALALGTVLLAARRLAGWQRKKSHGRPDAPSPHPDLTQTSTIDSIEESL